MCTFGGKSAGSAVSMIDGLSSQNWLNQGASLQNRLSEQSEPSALQADTFARSAEPELPLLSLKDVRMKTGADVSAAASASSAKPASAGNVHHADVVKRVPFSLGDWTELLHDPDPHLKQQNFHPRAVHRNPEIVKAFGTAAPPSSDVLLHYAGDPPPGVEKKPVPVLLVHGANKEGTFWWDPHENGEGKGLPQYLRDQGYQVFAVTFAHNQDDNFFWSQGISNSIDRIKDLTGSSQVDLMGHSKGGAAVRTYCSDYRQDWMSPYQGDVRKLFLLAAPNGGIDVSFRHSLSNYALYTGGDNPHLNAPMSWDKIMAFGVMVDTNKVGFGSDGPDYWPGQRQLLAKWDDKYPLPMMEPDWYTTYNGGRGFVSESKGMEYYMHQGGDYMEHLQASPIDPKIQVAVLAGNKPDIPGIVNEFTGPSDGLLFLESALKLPDSAPVVAEAVMPFNHKSIVGEEQAYRWIENVLSQEKLPVMTKGERAQVLSKALGESRAAAPPKRKAGVEMLSAAGIPSIPHDKLPSVDGRSPAPVALTSMPANLAVISGDISAKDSPALYGGPEGLTADDSGELPLMPCLP